MKTATGASGRRVFPGRRQFFWAAILSAITASTPGLAQTPGQRLPAIRGGLLFEQPLEAVAQSPTAAQEASLLQVAIASASAANADEVVEALEAYVAENPSSVWTPSLRARLGRHYCSEGYWTKALEHWERAWGDTKQYPTGPGKQVADYTLAFWTRLLVELGRLDELQAIFAEAEGRVLDGGPLTRKYLRTKEGYGILRQRPEAAYRCGWLVLNRLALATRGRGLDPGPARLLYQERNLLQSCSMSALAQIALNDQWSLLGVERPEGSQELPLPSAMHLKQGHYVALLRAEHGLVLAYDPIFGTRHFRREVLNAESSGRFLVGAGLTPAGWRVLSPDEMATTVGRSVGDSGGFGGFMDEEEADCSCGCLGNPPPPRLPPSRRQPRPRPGADSSTLWRGLGSGGDSGGLWSGWPQERDVAVASAASDGDSGSSCQDCSGESGPQGMLRWRVSEPNINLWLRDDPISCQPAYGPAVAFGLRFAQGDDQPPNEYVFEFGAGWHSPWHSHTYYIQRYGYYNTTLYLPGGGTLKFAFADGETVASNYLYNARLTATVSNDVAIAFTLDLPDGRKHVYEYGWQQGQNYHLYLTRSVDAQGFVTHFVYSQVEEPNWGTVLHLSTVTDQQGDLLFGLQYTNGTEYSSLVSAVTNRFGQSARLTYTENASGVPFLSRIEDAAGLASTVSYDEGGFPQALATPYGATTFT
jgi:hypothetical protein